MHTLKMRVNFEVNTHLVSEICQDNNKLVNMFLQCSLKDGKNHSHKSKTAWACYHIWNGLA